jgi:hypothetical protein
MTTRRRFLGTLGKALGAGGLLLPWTGKGALALPADLGKAAELPVAPATPPISSELLQLREVRRALHDCYLRQHDYPSPSAYQQDWFDLFVHSAQPLEWEIVSRRKVTWSDCTEIAEVAMHRMVRFGPADLTDARNALVYAVLSASGVTEVLVPTIGEEPICPTT